MLCAFAYVLANVATGRVVVLNTGDVTCQARMRGLSRSVGFGTLVSTRSLTVVGGDVVDLDGTGETIGVDAGPELQGQPVQIEISTLRNPDGRLRMEVDLPRSAEARATSPMELTAWQQAESRLRPHLALLVSGWLAGVCLLSVRPLIGWHSARRLQRVGLSEVSDSLQEMLSRLADLLCESLHAAL